MISNGFDRLSSVALVTTHFNPAGFSALANTYHKWLPTLGDLASVLTCIELVFDDDEPEIPGSIVKHGSRKLHGMWQLETLINIALASASPDIKYFGWLDHDTYQTDPDWLSKAVDLIDAGAVAVQLLNEIHYLDQQGNVDYTVRGLADWYCSSGFPLGIPDFR